MLRLMFLSILSYNVKLVSMTSISKHPVINDLAYSLDEMLGKGAGQRVDILSIDETHTAVTMRVCDHQPTSAPYFIKTVKKHLDPHQGLKLGLREVEFYDFIKAFDLHLREAVLKPISYDVDERTGTYYLVLEDLTDTHRNYKEIDFSDLKNWRSLVRALAGFHKAFSGRLTLSQIKSYSDDQPTRERYIIRLKEAFTVFKAYALDRVDEAVLSLLESSIPILRRIELEKCKRIYANKITTLVHRDAHVKNFLFPIDRTDKIKLIDWQFWAVGLGTYDLRHLLGSALPPQQRQYQKELVFTYYQTLMDGSSFDYDWDTCWLDYRKGVLDNLFMPVWQYTGFGWAYDLWAETLHSAVENFYALGCDQRSRAD